MKRVVERCPTCGVEHETMGDGTCEACGTPLRVWCRTHSREIGWLAGDECPRCPPSHAHVGPRGRAVAPAPAPAPPRPVVIATPPSPAAPPAAPAVPVVPVVPAVPAAAPVTAEEPAENPERRTRREPAPQGPFLRVFNAVLSLLQGGILGVLIGVGAGAVQAMRVGGDIPVTAVEWGVYGGMLGLLLGGVIAFFALFGSSPPPER